MKKLALFIFAGLFLASCENDETTQKDNSLTSKVTNPNFTTLHTEIEDWPCFGPPKECAPEIVTCGNCKTSQNNLVLELLTKNNSSIKQFIIDNRRELETVFHNSLISSLANGTISVYINKNVSANRDFVLFKSGEKIVAAYPFSLE